MKTIILISFLFTLQLFFAQDLPAYQIYNSKGKPVSFDKMAAATKNIDLVLFGEFHDNPIAHWLQLELTQRMHNVYQGNLQLGFEMFEQDQQVLLDAYLAGKLTDEQFKDTLRLWPNYTTDYAPLVNYAKENKLEFIATNIPRRYARLVNKGGFEALDTLPAIEKSYVAPLPIAFDAELPTYKSILEMMGEHGTPSLVKAQASKDATMAHFILKNYKTGKLFIHYNGAFHSDYYEGIGWYLKRQSPTLNYSTISTVTQADITKLNAEHIGKADFILVIDEDVTTTY